MIKWGNKPIKSLDPTIHSMKESVIKMASTKAMGNSNIQMEVFSLADSKKEYQSKVDSSIKTKISMKEHYTIANPKVKDVGWIRKECLKGSSKMEISSMGSYITKMVIITKGLWKME